MDEKSVENQDYEHKVSVKVETNLAHTRRSDKYIFGWRVFSITFQFYRPFFNLVDLEIEYSIAKNHNIHEMFSEMIKTSLRKRLRKKNHCASVIAAKW